MNRNQKVKIPFDFEIPFDWEIKPNRALFTQYTKKNMSELPLLSVSQSKGVTFQTDNTSKKDTSNEDKSKYKHVRSGDLVYNKMRMWQGAVGISNQEGIVSPAYVVLGKISENVLPEYFHYQFRSSFYICQSGIYSYGLCDDMNNLRYNDFKLMKSVVPDLKCQKSIVDKIEMKSQEVNQFIDKKLKYIKLLEGYRDSRINEIITKGLKKNIKVKDSKIDWIGEIPENWNIMRLRFLVKVNPTSKNTFLDEDLKCVFLPMELISENGTYSNEANAITKSVSQGYTYFEKGDIVIAKISPCFENRKGAFLDNLISEYGFGTTELHVLRNSGKIITSKYLFHILRSEIFIKLGILNMKGTAGQQRVPDSFVKNFRIAVPPIEEQNEIALAIEDLITDTDILIQKAHAQVELIEEYKSSLISELVAGTIRT